VTQNCQQQVSVAASKLCQISAIASPLAGTPSNRNKPSATICDTCDCIIAAIAGKDAVGMASRSTTFLVAAISDSE
jgi:hypothetical protein